VVALVRTQTVLATLILCASLAGCVDGGPSGTPGPGFEEQRTDLGAVRGIVVDDSQAPVKGAAVGIVELERETQTDDAGFFQISNIEPGSYSLASQKLGFKSHGMKITVAAAETLDVTITLEPVAVSLEVRTELVIGSTYIACGGYFVLVTLSQNNVCAFDTNHNPKFEFEAKAADLKGIMQELVWDRTSALTAERLSAELWYKPVCNPTCNGEKEYSATSSTSPIRQYIDLSREKFAEDLIPLASMNLPASGGTAVYVIFQQRTTHYVTIFYNQHGNTDDYTNIPDQ
jgi:hypothetical protein